MSDITTGEMPSELVPSVPPAPEAAAEVEAAPSEAAAPGAPEDDEERSLPFDVEHLGVLRRAVLDALLDADEPLSVSRILAEMPPGTSRNSCESAIKRCFDAGQIARTSPGTYRLAPPKPPEPPKPAPPSPENEAMWFAAFDAWINDPASWNVEELGPRPDEPGRRIPTNIIARGVDRSRKRQERQRDRESAAAKQAAADAELRNQLLATCRGNFTPGPGLNDMAPIKLILKTVPLDYVLYAIRQKVDRRCYPGNPPLVSWRDPVFLRAVADNFCGCVLIPGMVKVWGEAGKASASSPPAGSLPDDIDRSHHDSEHAPPGPHSLASPARTTPDVERVAPMRPTR